MKVAEVEQSICQRCAFAATLFDEEPCNKCQMYSENYPLRYVPDEPDEDDLTAITGMTEMERGWLG